MTDREKHKRMAPLRLLETYWQGLAGLTGEVPLRSQIDPRGIESALEFAFLGERIAPSLAKLRVAGTHLNELMGMETGGMPLSALFTPAARDRLGEALARVFSEGAMVRLDVAGEEGFGKTALEGHVLILPLRSDMGDMTRMIGMLVTTGRIGRTPRRFTITACTVEPALGAKPQPSLPEPEASRKQLTELAEPAASFTHKPRRTGKHPYLRLIVSND
ncbi:PAS domain-containing protein [Citreicella sp. C3M06]|uniref:PAS domain-containing protein n=1 Tax=Citreicella sp. C3M06 TaxID=2841564 RepID=UPI00209057BA|nr:PAS domain-containing protein [Citreicella sp. C3M06]